MTEENKELLTIEAAVTPAILTVDFDKLKGELEEELKQYDIVVTSDTVKGAKELATKLNKTAGAIDTRRKELVAEASEPIKAFDTGMKELVQLCKDGRTKITEQVATFEDEVKDKVRELLQAHLVSQYDAFDIEEEFRTIQTDDLVILSNITGKGNLAASGRNAVIERVVATQKLQLKVKERLLRLASNSYGAGLEAPLTRVHVDHFLFEDDEVYNDKLQQLIEAEFERQELAKQRKGEVETKTEAAREEKSEPARKSGRRNWQVTAVFDVDTGMNVTADQVTAALTKKMADAGFKTLSSVKVKEV